MKTLRRYTKKQTILAELTEAEWDHVAARDHRLIALKRAVDAIEREPIAGLQRMVKALPLAAGVEMAGVRLLAEESDLLYLVAREGLPSRNVRELALAPISVATQRSIYSLGGHHSQARSLGLRYVSGEWLDDGAGNMIGCINVGCRTDRRPSPDERALIRQTATELSGKLGGIDRKAENLRKVTHVMAREAILEPPDIPDGVLGILRPREATVLELYAEGTSVDEIARVLVISPHTVRTHIKLAFRRLGVHSREEAAELVRTSQVTALL